MVGLRQKKRVKDVRLSQVHQKLFLQGRSTP